MKYLRAFRSLAVASMGVGVMEKKFSLLSGANMSGDFTPLEDPFPSPDVFKNGESQIDDRYKAVSDKLFGKKTEDEMKTLIGEFKEAVKKEGLVVDGRKNSKLICKFDNLWA